MLPHHMPELGELREQVVALRCKGFSSPAIKSEEHLPSDFGSNLNIKLQMDYLRVSFEPRYAL